MSTETYNPQERTFIRRLESEICHACGQPIPPKVVPIEDNMANYIDDKNGIRLTINSKEPYITVQGQTFRRETISKIEDTPQDKFISNETPQQELKPAPRGK